MLPQAILFDLDNTLAQSKQPITEDMAETLSRLLAHTKVAIISGGAFAQLAQQAARQLPEGSHLENLYLLPTSGAALYGYTDGVWQNVYEQVLSQEDVDVVIKALQEGARSTGLINLGREQYGPYIENRGAQISLSALGQKAPIDAKKMWDPSREKRESLQRAIVPLLHDFDVKIGGTTTIDVTKRGINKAFGVRKLAEHLSFSIPHMLYVGDELIPGGNDDVVKETGIPTHAVTGPEDTRTYIESLLAI